MPKLTDEQKTRFEFVLRDLETILSSAERVRDDVEEIVELQYDPPLDGMPYKDIEGRFWARLGDGRKYAEDAVDTLDCLQFTLVELLSEASGYKRDYTPLTGGSVRRHLPFSSWVLTDVLTHQLNYCTVCDKTIRKTDTILINQLEATLDEDGGMEIVSGFITTHKRCGPVTDNGAE